MKMALDAIHRVSVSGSVFAQPFSIPIPIPIPTIGCPRVLEIACDAVQTYRDINRQSEKVKNSVEKSRDTAVKFTCSTKWKCLRDAEGI
jgi:hypothetical protein